MLVMCKICKKKNEKDSSYRLVVNGKNQYYCNQKEYLDDEAKKKAKNEVFKLCDDIIGRTTNVILFKEMNLISEIHGYIKIFEYLQENLSRIKGFMSRSFDSEYGKIRYFTTIIKNSIGDFVVETKEKRIVEVEVTEVNYKARVRKKSLSEYLNEYEEA